MRFAAALLAALVAAGSIALTADAQPAPSGAYADLIAAAKKEGEVVLNGPPLDVVRETLTSGFEKAYGIKVSYVTGGGPQAGARVRAERAAGKYLLDVLISGSDTPVLTFLPSGWLDPIEPILIAPGLKDGRTWKDGHVWYVDPHHTILRLIRFVTPEIAINTSLVKPRDVTSWKALLDARWQGKIVVKDPTISGAGASLISFFYLHFGPEFVKHLYVDQKPVVNRDPRQMVQWLAQGTYPIVVGPDNTIVDQFKKLGYPIAFVDPRDAPGIVSGGFGFISLLNRAPHPNAAKLLVNWLASRQGSEALTVPLESASLRNDIPANAFPDYTLPKRGRTYLDTYDYDFITNQRDAAFQKVRDLLGQ